MEIELNNKNKTKFEFSYDNGLPYKKAIRPELEYGDWEENPNKLLFKVLLCEQEYSLFKNPSDINCIDVYFLQNEIWFDLIDVYLVVDYDSIIKLKLEEKNFIFVFIYKNEVFSVLHS